MSSESQYIELYRECRSMIHQHSAPLMNALRDEAMADFEAQGFPSQKVERYKYTDVAKAFAPNYGVNLNRVNIPADTADRDMRYRRFFCTSADTIPYRRRPPLLSPEVLSAKDFS